MNLIEMLKEYIKPELLVVAVVLYFIGIGIKNTELIKDKYIPVILGTLGVIISAIYSSLYLNKNYTILFF